MRGSCCAGVLLYGTDAVDQIPAGVVYRQLHALAQAAIFTGAVVCAYITYGCKRTCRMYEHGAERGDFLLAIERRGQEGAEGQRCACLLAFGEERAGADGSIACRNKSAKQASAPG